MTRVDARPRCAHGVPLVEHCSECTPTRERPAGRVTRLADIRIEQKQVPLNLPPLGPHTSVVSRAKGCWIVTCSCGHPFRVKSKDRHEIESAWGRHRHT